MKEWLFAVEVEHVLPSFSFWVCYKTCLYNCGKDFNDGNSP